jgi:hypothetical protein
MKGTLILGILLIAFGIFSFVYRGVSYTEREKVLDVGPIEATTEQKKTVPIHPLLGTIALVGGVALLVAGARRSV